MSTELDNYSGEVARRDCPIDVCDGERVTIQDSSLPPGCTDTHCTGECGHIVDYEGNRLRGSAMMVKYDTSRRGIKEAFVCPREGCTERVPAFTGYPVEALPYEAPDDIVNVTFHHACAECESTFAVGESETGERRHLTIE